MLTMWPLLYKHILSQCSGNEVQCKISMIFRAFQRYKKSYCMFPYCSGNVKPVGIFIQNIHFSVVVALELDIGWNVPGTTYKKFVVSPMFQKCTNSHDLEELVSSPVNVDSIIMVMIQCIKYLL